MVIDDDGHTSVPGVFAAGDATVGKAAVVLAAAAGSRAAYAINAGLANGPLPGMPPTDVRPGFVVPMKAVLTADRPAGPEWVFERKLDGIRCLAVKHGGGTRLYSRNELSLNDRYAPLAAALDADPADGFVVDGEAVAFVGGRDRFGGGEGGELFYYVFDVLYANGRDVRSLPLEERRAVLEGLLHRRDPLRMTEQMTGDGAALLADACRDGWEGLIAKRLGTPYVSTRSRDWLKLKCTRAQELVIGGYTAPRGSRTDLGALLVGHFDGDRLRYAGKVGTGFTRPTLRELSERLAPLVRESSPFEPEPGIPRAATWVEPELVAQIAFMEWTSDGRLRHPSFLGLRFDKPAREVVREEPYPKQLARRAPAGDGVNVAEVPVHHHHGRAHEARNDRVGEVVPRGFNGRLEAHDAGVAVELEVAERQAAVEAGEQHGGLIAVVGRDR